MQTIKSSTRNGNITSSEIVNLLFTGSRPMTDDELRNHLIAYPKSKKKNIDVWPGKAAITYINQCNMERRLERSLDGDLDTRAVNWGKFVETLLFSMLQEMYTYNSNDTLVHPLYDYWVGTPDGYKICGQKTVVDAKCPFTLESFCQLINPLYDGLEGLDAMTAIREGYTDQQGLFHAAHKDGDKFYWQLVSNACIDDCTHAELIVYCPYESELSIIKAMAVQSGDPSAYYISNASPKGLPSLKDDGFYKNINVISFKIPESDKELLTETVKKAGAYLL
jgi:hypothetical protein